MYFNKSTHSHDELGYVELSIQRFIGERNSLIYRGGLLVKVWSPQPAKLMADQETAWVTIDASSVVLTEA